MEACHLNGNRLDSSLKNLRWDTRSNNALDKRHHKTWQGAENNGNSKLTNAQAKEIRLSKLSVKKLADIFKVAESTILRVKKQETYDFRKINI